MRLVSWLLSALVVALIWLPSRFVIACGYSIDPPGSWGSSTEFLGSFSWLSISHNDLDYGDWFLIPSGLAFSVALTAFTIAIRRYPVALFLLLLSVLLASEEPGMNPARLRVLAAAPAVAALLLIEAYREYSARRLTRRCS